MKSTCKFISSHRNIPLFRILRTTCVFIHIHASFVTFHTHATCLILSLLFPIIPRITISQRDIKLDRTKRCIVMERFLAWGANSSVANYVYDGAICRATVLVFEAEKENAMEGWKVCWIAAKMNS